MYTPCNLELAPNVTVVASKMFVPATPGEATITLIVLGTLGVCREAVVTYEGSISYKLHNIKLPAEDVFEADMLEEGVCRFVLG